MGKGNVRKKSHESQADIQSIFRKIDYLICPNNKTFQKHNDVQETKVCQSLKEGLTNFTSFVRTEILVTVAIIIDKLFKFNHACELLEERFSPLVEEKYAYISQEKLKIGRKKYTLLRKTYDVLSFGGILPEYKYIFCIDTIKVVSLMKHIQ